MAEQERMDRWSKLPQARYLFNSPYHCAAPQTSEDCIRRILHHIARCAEERCSCGLQEYIHQRQLGHEDLIGIITKVAPETSPPKHSRVQTSGSSNRLEQEECVITKIVNNRRTMTRQSRTNPVIEIQNNRIRRLCLKFPDATKDWSQFDANCATEDDTRHYNTALGLDQFSLSTQVLQDLRSGMIGAEIIHRYFTVLCNSVVHVNVRHIDPAFTTVIAGLEVDPTVQPHRRFTDTHLFCD